MIAIIRISGLVNIRSDIEETLSRLRLRRKYACVVIKPTKEKLGMIKKVKEFVAFGEIDKKTYEELVEKRGQLIDKTKKTDLKKAAEEIEKGKEYEHLNLKPFFQIQ